VVQQTLPFQMLYYFTDNQFTDTAVKFLVDSLIKSKWDVKQISADESSSKIFAEKYAKATNKTAKNSENWVTYKLNKLKQIKTVDGKLRKSTPDDMYFLPFWCKEFNMECGLEPIANDISYQVNAINEGNKTYYLWERNNIPVATASLSEVSKGVASIGCVFTPVYFRGNGFATNLVWRICKDVLTKYSEVTLYADADNPISNKCYSNIGFNKVCVKAVYTFN
jgi:predicted GNAT family acetyltransferase